ncbi:MAG TPA: DUF4160 domain-containing protein [Rhodospirillales bacterium]|nr:DUF4160 domain-containing protein [Rhodospirillales bacterium]
MPTIIKIDNFKIQMFPKDHTPPHYHVYGPGFKVSLAIEDNRVLSGKASARVIRKAAEWADAIRGTLENLWKEMKR